MNKKISLSLVTLVIFLMSATTWAKGVKQTVHFKKGTSSSTIHGSVIRGDQDQYILGVREGQTMTLKITSPEKNAVFTVYQPGYSIKTDEYGDDISGKTTVSESTEWTGKLPASGDFLIVVGNTRGNSTYQLTVSVK